MTNVNYHIVEMVHVYILSHCQPLVITLFQARLYHELGYRTERNQCSLEFKQLDQLYPTFHASLACGL